MNRSLDGSRVRLEQTVARWNTSLRRFSVYRIAADAGVAFTTHQMTLLAASLSYYALLALFPILLLLIALASLFLAESDVLHTVSRLVGDSVPGAGQELDRILREVVNTRGPATIIGLVTLVWSGSGFFDVLQTALDRAWHVPNSRQFWQQRLISLAVIAVIALLFLASIVVSAFADNELRELLHFEHDTFVVLGNLIGIAGAFVAFAVVYKVFPHVRVPWRAALVAAATSTVFWEIAKGVYQFYLLHFARFNLVYGSLGAIIGLLLWGYISAAILLFGGELSAAVARETGLGKEQVASSGSQVVGASSK